MKVGDEDLGGRVEKGESSKAGMRRGRNGEQGEDCYGGVMMKVN